jgi:hypothetical protein
MRMKPTIFRITKSIMRKIAAYPPRRWAAFFKHKVQDLRQSNVHKQKAVIYLGLATWSSENSV